MYILNIPIYIYICITDICTLLLQFAGTLPQESNLAIQGEEKRGGEGIPFSKHCRTGPKSLQSLTREMGEMLSFLKLKPLLLLQLGSVCKIIKKTSPFCGWWSSEEVSHL